MRNADRRQGAALTWECSSRTSIERDRVRGPEGRRGPRGTTSDVTCHGRKPTTARPAPPPPQHTPQTSTHSAALKVAAGRSAASRTRPLSSNSVDQMPAHCVGMAVCQTPFMTNEKWRLQYPLHLSFGTYSSLPCYALSTSARVRRIISSSKIRAEFQFSASLYHGEFVVAIERCGRGESYFM